MNSKCVDQAVERYSKVARYDINPFRCLYFNPHKYDIIKFAKWCQKYVQNRVYTALVKITPITGYEVVPSELLMRQSKRDGYAGRRLMAGGLSFYLIRQAEMSKGLLQRYLIFKEELSKVIRKEVSYVDNEGVTGE